MVAAGAPLHFEPNRGQSRAEVRYVARSRGLELGLTAQGASLRFGANEHRLRWKWQGANRAARIEAEDALGAHSNYFFGRDSRRWVTDVPHFARVRYRDLYPGVDLAYYGHEGRLEYDLVLAPGAAPETIRLAVEDSAPVRLDGGDLVLGSAGAELRQHAPRAWQRIGGVDRPVRAEYVLTGKNRVGFRVGNYDRSRELVIDPVLTFSTYLGGINDDVANRVIADAAGNAYVVGTTGSAGAGKKVMVSKFKPDGTLVYASVFGGSYSSAGLAIAIDEDGKAYVTGNTRADDFPAVNALQPNIAGEKQYGLYPTEAFVAIVNADGNKLLYSTYLGGSGADEGDAITLDSDHNIYITGMTESTDFPLSNAVQSQHGPGSPKDAFIAKLAADGSSLVYSTYLGGGGNESGYALALDRDNRAYITGFTNSQDFPGNPPYQNMGLFVLRVSANGGTLEYSRTFGGLSEGRDIALDSAGDVYIAGYGPKLFFNGIPSERVFGPFGGSSWDALVMKLNPTAPKLLDELVWGGFIGGSANEAAYAMALDSAGNVYVAGDTSSNDFPSKNALQSGYAGGDRDAFLARVKADGTGVDFATFLGGGGNDSVGGLAMTGGHLFIAGVTDGLGFPVVNAIKPDPLGYTDAFVARVDFEDAMQAAPQVSSLRNVATMTNQATQDGYLAPGETIVIYGKGLGPDTRVDASLDSGQLPTTLAGVRVLFDGTPAPLVSVGAESIIAVAPYALSEVSETRARVEYNGRQSDAIYLNVAYTDLGLLTAGGFGDGQALAYNEDGAANAASNPAVKGSLIMLTGTGEGQTSPQGVDGQVVTDPAPIPVYPITAKIGDLDAEVVSATETPGLWPGMLRVVLRIPDGASTGDAIPVNLFMNTMGDYSQDGVTIAIK